MAASSTLRDVCGRIGPDVNGTAIFGCVQVEEPSALIPLYFLFVGMMLGALTLWAQLKFVPWFPFAACIFIQGILLGSLHEGVKQDESDIFPGELLTGKLGDLSLSIEAWISIDPFLLMAVFLPGLIFADAMKVNIHEFKTQAFWPSLLLAGPGVVANAGIMGAVAYHFLGYGWDWYASLLFGAVLSAPDPVAVVALLESSGAPARLTLLMSSESHIADLTALVLFKLFLDLVTLNEILETPASTAYFFAKMLLIGPLVGLVFGYAGYFAIKQSVSPTRASDTMLQITVTITVAYLSFLVAEKNLSANGILASVIAAWVFAGYAWPKFANRVTMENVWSAIEFFANTLIFLLAGVILGSTVYDSVALVPRVIGSEDILNVFIMWGLLYASRTAIVLVGYPLLYQTSKKKFKPNEGVALILGGLRGAVTITLAIVILNTTKAEIFSDELKKHFGEEYEVALTKFFFLVGSVTMLTLVVNYTTFPPILNYLKVSTPSKSKEKLHDYVRKRIRENAVKQYNKIRERDAGYESVSLDKIQELITSAHLVTEVAEIGNVEPKSSDSNVIDPDVVQLGDCDQKLLKNVRMMFLNAVRAQYWDQINEGKLPRKSAAALILLDSVDIAADEVSYKLDDYSHLRLVQRLENATYAERLMEKVDVCLPSCVTFDNYLFFRIKHTRREEAVTLATCFIEAHIHAEERIAQYVGDDETIDTPEEAYAIKESRELREKAVEILDKATAEDAEVVDHINTVKMANALIENERLFIESLHDQGLVGTLFVEDQMERIRRDQVDLERARLARFKKLATTRALRQSQRLSSPLSPKVGNMDP